MQTLVVVQLSTSPPLMPRGHAHKGGAISKFLFFVKGFCHLAIFILTVTIILTTIRNAKYDYELMKPYKRLMTSYTIYK